jgi:hypothetical protein
MGKAKSHSGNVIVGTKPPQNVLSVYRPSIDGVYSLGSPPFEPLVRWEKSRYTPFLRHYDGHENDLSGGFPVEKLAQIRTSLRKTRPAFQK